MQFVRVLLLRLHPDLADGAEPVVLPGSHSRPLATANCCPHHLLPRTCAFSEPLPKCMIDQFSYLGHRLLVLQV